MILSLLLSFILATTPVEVYQKAAGLYEQSRYQEVSQMLGESLPEIREAEDPGLLGETLSLLGAALIPQGKLEEASDYLRQAYPILDSLKKWGSVAFCRLQQGLIARIEGFENLAANYFRETRDLSLKIGDKQLQKKAAKELSTLLKVTDPSEAARFLQEYASLSDTIFQEKTEKQETEFKIQQEAQDQEHDLDIKEIEVRNLKTQRLLLILIIGLLVIALILIIWLATIRQKNVRMLRQALAIKERILQIHETPATLEEKHEKMSGVIEDLSHFGEKEAETLTSREKEIAQLCCEGLISKEIANRLGLSPRTVETHKNNIFRKLDIHTTEELIRWMNKNNNVCP